MKARSAARGPRGARPLPPGDGASPRSCRGARPSGSGGGSRRLFLRGSASRRRILFENLAAALPRKEPRGDRSASDARRPSGSARPSSSSSRSRGSREADVRSRIEISGEENLRAARARGKGVFLLSAHIGSWELGAIRAGLLGEPIAPVVRPLDNPRLEGELARLRTRFGNRLIAKRDAANDILRALAKNETVAILVDQNVLAREAVFVPFFGRLAATTPAARPPPAEDRRRGRAGLHLARGRRALPPRVRDADPRRGVPGLPPGARRVRRATARYMEVTEAAVRAGAGGLALDAQPLADAAGGEEP